MRAQSGACLGHEGADAVVGEQQPVGLLEDLRRSLAAEDDLLSGKVGFDLVVPQLDLPAIVVSESELFGRVGHRIQERGDEPHGGKALELVLDDSDLDPRR